MTREVAQQRPLFRQEAVEFQQHARQWGHVVPLQSWSARLTIWFIIAAVASIIGFLFAANYARKETVSGYLMPAAGSARIFPTQAGTVSGLFVEQGESVEQGQPLMAVTTSQVASNGEDVNATIVNTLQQQKDQLLRQITTEDRRTASEHERLVAQIQGLEAELGHLAAQANVQRERIR